jgi:hypothetical protein
MSDTMVIELALPNSTYLELKQAAQQKHTTEAELAVEAVRAYLTQWTKIDPLLGLYADEPELADSIMQDAMQSRENTPLQLAEVTGG